ncbi:MAG: hypothetical protein IJG80_10655 [Selenomonadaceae bacterium]|nr:hypothetical protein [Selenomonadaceae bacterium]MBQ3727507.1 hypothetical protein [Selenomonadaceae bacterium]MBQ9497432.1 hypothetical protein [Selenomonadaceae bacterium]
MVDIKSEILLVSKETDIPVFWVQIFAECVQRVADRLGVELDTRSGGRGHCIFITPQSFGYSADSITNLNFAGFDYARAWKQPGHAFDMYTVIGVNNNWYNRRLFPKLNDPNLIKIVEDIYRPCCFRRLIRINKAANTFYAFIKDYDCKSLADCLRDALASGIWFSYMTPVDCMTKLNSLGMTSGDAIDKLKRYRYKDYNWLEHLNIVTEPPIKCELFLAKDPATLAEFERQLAQHIIGMILLDLIFREDRRVALKIKALIDKM